MPSFVQKRSVRKAKGSSAIGSSSPRGLLFVTFLFVCITMVSFIFHEDDGGLPSQEEELRGASANPYTTTIVKRGKLLKPDKKFTSQSVQSAAITSSFLPAATTTRISASMSTPDTARTTTDVNSKSSQAELSSLWMGRMLTSLQGQPMLLSNALSKVHQWEGVVVDPSLHQEGQRKRVLFYMGEHDSLLALH